MVSCRYLQAEGQNISLRLDIGAPPPSMLILIQRLPRGTAIRAASPSLQKYDQATGEAKWLLKKLQPGSMLFTLELDQPVSAQAVSGEIRYKSQASETTVTMPIRP
ncbi:MAG: hypothetical protein OEV91_04980 [Desulfobulbaceae bacterium]|nr:hypothetical protein [Desulfobulbaceae bacterium]